MKVSLQSSALRLLGLNNASTRTTEFLQPGPQLHLQLGVLDRHTNGRNDRRQQPWFVL
jgi:hypothetical protein